jgi:hypothetical protein
VMNQRDFLWHLSPRQLKEVAALRVQDAKTAHTKALKALARYEATGCGLDYAQKTARLARETHQSALRGLEALTFGTR